MPEQVHGQQGLVHIPGHLLPVRLSQIGFSKRLQTALRTLGKHFLGDLHGISTSDLLSVDPRGVEIMSELVDGMHSLAALAQSLNSSSTDPPQPLTYYPRPSYRKGSPCAAQPKASRITLSSLENQNGHACVPENIAPLLAALESRLHRLLPRDLKIIEQRYGAHAPPATLFEIAVGMKLTTEAIRKILRERLQMLREFGGPDFSRHLAALSDHCHAHNLTLTPALLSQWISSINNQPSSINDFSFLLRLLSELDPNLPTWPSAKTLH